MEQDRINLFTNTKHKLNLHFASWREIAAEQTKHLAAITSDGFLYCSSILFFRCVTITGNFVALFSFKSEIIPASKLGLGNSEEIFTRPEHTTTGVFL